MLKKIKELFIPQQLLKGNCGIEREMLRVDKNRYLSFTDLGLPKIPSLISIVFTALRIPMALMFVGRFGINGVWMSISISSILKGITSYIMYLIVVKMKL